MRYEDEQRKKGDTGTPVASDVKGQAVSENMEQENEELPGTMEQASDDVVDQFQAVVYNAGSKALSMLSADALTKGLEADRRKKVNDMLKNLGAFRYNIGFAGPQSCGKSSLINAIIRYPLMPTCNLATTCTPVELIYGKETRIVVKDEDRNGKIVFDRKCGSISQKDFDKLVDYACKVMPVAVIENLQFFCDVSILSQTRDLKRHMHMDRSDPQQVALLFLILFTVYAHQNNKELTNAELELNELRLKTLAYFGIRQSTINYRVVVQWGNPMLASGLMITDLPGLGSSAEDKKENDVVIKGHDTITKEAVLRTDTMAFMSEPQVMADAVPALETMISNANIRDAVSVEERIVPIMNKVDQLPGAQKETAINMMLGMMRNVGANMNDRKVWETSSYCGEYAYEGLDVKRSFYVMREAFKMLDEGCSEEEIEEELPGVIRKMKRGYEKSGVNELREFFRSAFIGRGKYQKTFSTVIALRALALDMVTPLRNMIDSGTALAEVNEDLANEALGYLEEAATTPLNDAQKTDQVISGMVDKHMGIIDPMISAATTAYETVLSNAVEDYADRLQGITCQFDLTYLGLGNRARVDSGAPHNHDLYQDLMEESEVLKVDLKPVNKIHADALRYCGDAVAGIYESARDRLVTFQKDYPGIMKDCIDKYRGKADPEVIALMESLLPSLQQYVSTKIVTADAAIQNQRSSFQDVADQLARDIVELNDEFVSVLLNMVQGKLGTVQGGWFTKKDFLVVDGDNGLNATIRNLGLTRADRENIHGLVAEKGADFITNRLREWYQTAANDVNQITGSLTLEFVSQFNTIRKNLEEKTKGMESSVEQAQKTLEVLNRVFRQMREDIQPHLDRILDLEGAGNSPLKGDLFEGMMEAQGGVNG